MMGKQTEGGFKLEQRHGKARVRVARVWRNKPDGPHVIVEWCVSISLLSECLTAYTRGDNSDIVATDTMKNTVYAKAKECVEQVSVEDFAVLLAKHFTSLYQQVTCAIVNIVEKPWERVSVDGETHEHGFKLGSERHTTEVILEKSGALRMTSGIEGLAVLKTTKAQKEVTKRNIIMCKDTDIISLPLPLNMPRRIRSMILNTHLLHHCLKSGFEGFIRDKYTALPDTRERILATEITASWRYLYESIFSIPLKPLYFTERYLNVKKVLTDTFYGPPKEGIYSPSVQSTLYDMAKTVLKSFPDIAAVQLKMPNLHFLPVNLSNKDGTIVKFEDDVYVPTDEPHGSIQATLSRLWSKM
ncbi:putative factor independent urate hydroxylase [Rosa chinensis]|uniref:factor independent urate hydroxylase n=1 Tax=Rosa chinensis TaxID=74649 RepID=A0A2P6SA10_ROSCH|nr:putative factor independent urate hydroxylase [Rosa chinensis]